MKLIINCFCEDSPYGIGDFLRGSIHLFQRLGYMNINFDVDFSKHPISNFIQKNNKTDFDKSEIEIIKAVKETEDSKELFEEIDQRLIEITKQIRHRQVKRIFTNYHWLLKLSSEHIMPNINKEQLSEECKSFFKRKIVFAEEIEEKAQEFLKEKKLEDGFQIIHFRLGDNLSFYKMKNDVVGAWQPDFEDCWMECVEILEKQKEKLPIVVMSDSNELKKFIKKEAKKQKLPIYIVHKESNHTQQRPNKEYKQKIKKNKKDAFYVALDMKILTMAKKVDAFSMYFWGSGFATWICKIFDVPITLMPFVDKERYLQN